MLHHAVQQSILMLVRRSEGGYLFSKISARLSCITRDRIVYVEGGREGGSRFPTCSQVDICLVRVASRVVERSKVALFVYSTSGFVDWVVKWPNIHMWLVATLMLALA